jgi:hypothetical protein
VIRIPYQQYFPPDPTSLNFFLSNRQRELWRRDPDGNQLNFNFNLEQVVLTSLRLEGSAKSAPTVADGPADEAKLIEDMPRS